MSENKKSKWVFNPRYTVIKVDSAYDGSEQSVERQLREIKTKARVEAKLQGITDVIAVEVFYQNVWDEESQSYRPEDVEDQSWDAMTVNIKTGEIITLPSYGPDVAYGDYLVEVSE